MLSSSPPSQPGVVHLADYAPGHGPRRAAVPAFRRYRLLDLARLLAIDHLERRTQIDRLRALARLDGLPLPLNDRRVRKDRVLRGPAAICAASEWDAAAIDAWRCRPDPAAPDRLPPIPAPVIDLRAHMADTARRLAAGGAR